MNVNIRRHILTFALTSIGILVVGCESPQPTTTQHDELNNTTQTESIESLKSRLLESYALYWPLISSENQHEQLPTVLSDPLPELRQFGIERVAVLLRDGEATEDELQLVVDHLRDLSPAVRFAAAKLLPEINVPGLPEYVANSMATELDLLVIEEELLFFRTRPHPKAIEPTIALLSLATVDSAATTLIELLNSNQISEETTLRIVQTVQKTRRTKDSPPLITLEAMLGNQSVQRKLIPLLEHPNVDVRLAVAKGFSASGYTDPLIARETNPEFYEYALAAIQKRVDIESFKQLMLLYRPNNELWNAATFAVATTLNTNSLLDADDMLKRNGMNELRLLVLSAVWESSADENLDARKDIARRAAPLMISTGDAVGALQLLDEFGESLVDEDLLTLRFEAAISASAWDSAADALSIPEPWIAAWQSVLVTDPTAAAVIRQQISQRFEDQLTQQQRDLLGIVLVDTTTEQDR